ARRAKKLALVVPLHQVIERVWNIWQVLKAECRWRSTKTNVTDHLARGLPLGELMKCQAWWQGPDEINEYRLQECSEVVANLMQASQMNKVIASCEPGAVLRWPRMQPSYAPSYSICLSRSQYFFHYYHTMNITYLVAIKVY